MVRTVGRASVAREDNGAVRGVAGEAAEEAVNPANPASLANPERMVTEANQGTRSFRFYHHVAQERVTGGLRPFAKPSKDGVFWNESMAELVSSWCGSRQEKRETEKNIDSNRRLRGYMFKIAENIMLLALSISRKVNSGSHALRNEWCSCKL